MFESLTQSAWADTIGWMLIHSLWQFAMVALLVLGLQWALRRASAVTRYWVLLVAMGIMVALPIATCFLLRFDDTAASTARLASAEQSDTGPQVEMERSSISGFFNSTALQQPDPATLPPETADSNAAEISVVPFRPEGSPPSLASETVLGTPDPSPFLLQEYIRPWLPTIVLVWLAGVLVAAARPLLSWRMVRRLRMKGVLPVEERVYETLQRAAGRLKLRRAVEVLQSTLVKTPMVVGYFRPVILLPLSVVSGLPESQLELILAHELAHIRQHDYLINLLQTLVETLFFYHPAMWWLSRQIRNERENCCDDAAMLSMGNRLEYGRALLAVVELREAATTLSLTSQGGSLIDRMRRITGSEPGPRIVSGGSILCVLLVLVALFAAGSWAADSKSDTKNAPPTITAEAFSKLSGEKQRTTLVEAFEKRLERGKNLFYEIEQISQWRQEKKRKSDKDFTCLRDVYRYWRLGDSFKVEELSYDDPKATKLRRYSAIAENGEEGIRRNVSRFTEKNGEKHQNGQVVFPHKQKPDDFFFGTPTPDELNNEGSPRRFFRYLVASKDKFEIEAPVDGDKVRLSIPWHGDKQVFLLDPEKDFLPIAYETKMVLPATENRDAIVDITQFDVLESRQIGGVWMPVKMSKQMVNNGELRGVTETTFLRSEVGQVKPADLKLPFTEGMNVQDVIEGITYTADAKDRATKVKDSPNWKHDPPEGWKKGKVDKACSLASKISDADLERIRVDRVSKSKPIDEALAVLKADPPASQEERIEAALKIFRACQMDRHETNAWAFAVRDLIMIGKPAVPRLIEELDKTDSNKMFRTLGFVLRGIDDPRAIPALIRAIPRLIGQSGSDGGLTLDDPELLKFIWMHDNAHLNKKDPPQPHDGMRLFNYGRPIREIMPALQKLTGKTFHWGRLNFADRKADDINQLRLQRTLFLDHAKQWADWWSKNWQNFVDNEADAQLELIEKSLRQFAQTIADMPQQPIPTQIPCGPNVKMGDRASYHNFERYMDLDVNRKVPVPKDLFEKSPKDKPSDEVLAWARRNGVDLLRIEVKRPDDEATCYGYHPVDMKVWKIDNRRAKDLEVELLKSKKLDLPLWEGPLSSVGETEDEIDPEQKASFLFITKQGACGLFQIHSGTAKFSSVDTITGSGSFSYRFIYQELNETSKAEPRKPEPWEISKRYDPAFLRYRFAHDETLPEPIVVPAVEGRVVDPSGKPVPNVTVVSYTPRHVVQIQKGGALKPHQHGPTTETNSKGEFKIPERKEPYRVLVACQQGITSMTHEELIHAEGRITLEPWSRIEGTFVLDGKPQANQRIFYYPDILPWAYSRHSPHPQFDDYHTKTDEKGRFVIDHAPPLDGRLYGSVDGLRSHCQIFKCEPGKTTHVELGTGCTLIGQLRIDPEGNQNQNQSEPVPWKGLVSVRGATLPLPVPDQISKDDTKAVEQWQDEWNQTAEGQAFQDKNHFLMNLSCLGKINSDGSFRIAGVLPGKYILHLSAGKEHPFQSKELVVDSAAGSSVDLGVFYSIDSKASPGAMPTTVRVSGN